MNYYICQDCWEVFKSDIDLLCGRPYTGTCPNIFCEGTIFRCDELMITPILLLNKKGYATQWCCSGHAYEPICSGYIAFVNNVPCSPPEGWSLDSNKTIRFIIKDKDPAERQKGICEKMASLITWCQGLEDLHIVYM